eukprot:TRINITY_DN49471_c0_g1_i1.p1 TRINITY_DN49471_c0_g1~~TRINITY_DN49471_c0_g1_i1.p1  ORF type:complete len:218 (-),score=40.72 TRINITY_DN49471_c0_g1_i1:410-1063(-)
MSSPRAIGARNGKSVNDVSHLTDELLETFQRSAHQKARLTKEVLEAFQRSIDVATALQKNSGSPQHARVRALDLRNHSRLRQSGTQADSISTRDSLPADDDEDPWGGVPEVLDDIENDEANDCSSIIVSVRGRTSRKPCGMANTRDSLIGSGASDDVDLEVESSNSCSSTLVNVRGKTRGKQYELGSTRDSLPALCGDSPSDKAEFAVGAAESFLVK